MTTPAQTPTPAQNLKVATAIREIESVPDSLELHRIVTSCGFGLKGLRWADEADLEEAAGNFMNATMLRAAEQKWTELGMF